MSGIMAKPANKDQIVDSLAAPAAAGAPAPLDGQLAVANAGPVGEQNEFPCSVAQERFWLLDRLEPGNSSYNVAVRWRLEGRVHTNLLERAWLAIIERHEILRTVFREVDGVPVQRVMFHAEFRLQEIDLSTLPREQARAEADRIGVMEARAPFDLASGPILRVTLLRLAPSVAIILVTTHQIVSDGWSIGVMAREMGVIYDALRRERPLTLDPLTIQYADYSLWQLEWLRVRGTDAETEYWTRQLAGVKPFKVIPDRPRPAVPTTGGAIVSRVLPRELTNKAQALSAERGATLFAAALAALCATLARFTGEDEIVIGTQVSDRDQVELEPMIGQFVNSLILRNDVRGDPPFSELLDRVRDTSGQALEYRHIPIERLLGMIKGEAGVANSPPISVNFIFQKTFIQNTAYGDFSLIDMPSLPAGAIYDLNFFMVERPDGWRLSCQYNTDQFEGATAERLLDYFQCVLKSALARPERRVSELTLSPPGEARLLFARLNDTRTLYPRELTLVRLFDIQVMRAPLATAVICDDRELTYGELDAAANRFAEYLRERGVARGSRVGVCLANSLELPICLLGILKTGATYVPMDPADSPHRRARLVRAAKVTAIIGQELLPLPGIGAAARLIEIESALAYVSRKPGVQIEVPLESDAAACLVFAAADDPSQVVSISHRNLSNVIYSLAKRPGVGERDVVVANSPTTLDRAIFEIFLPLLTGARLVIPDDRDLASGRTLLHLLQRTGATVMFGTSQTWSRLLGTGWIGYPALKMFCATAELSPRLIDQLAAMDGELWAVYGHPRGCLWSSIQRLKPKQTFTAVGEPIANASLYVLDGQLRLAPIGTTGELYVGGEALVEQGEFVPDPFSTAPGAKLYRTGDAARLRATGQIEYLGTKGLGFTHLGRPVEPEEIERALLHDVRVAEAAVVHRENAAGESIIAAYIVLRRKPLAASELITQIQSKLADALPAILVPSSLTIRDALPRTPEGKLDRRALKTLRIAADGGNGGEQPSGEIEERIAQIWRSALKVPSIAVTDNFFEMGGHSLLAARMLAQLERAFGRRIALATLFGAPTIQALAKVLAQTDPREFDFRQMVKLQPNGSKTPLIAVNNTGNYYLLAKYLGPDQPFISLQLFDPSVKTEEMPQKLEDVASDYVKLIRRVQPNGPYNLMGWCVAGALAFEIAHQLTQSEKVTHLFLMDSWIPRYIDRQPPLRRLVSAYSLRWQLVLVDWKKLISGQKSFSAFFGNRTIVKKVLRLWARATGRPQPFADSSAAGRQSTEDYDRWLLHYLQELTARYEPGMYEGEITLFRSANEPTGWFFDPTAGWGNFTTRGVDMSKVTGDHFTMFQSTGAAQMAEKITALIERKQP
jgi:non-ribosomal peptide synthetase component F/thioesterase domain-containing protein/acyl carrier protein